MNNKTTCEIQTIEIKPNRFLRYRTPWCDLLGCCSTSKSLLHFYYKLEDLQEEITKRTSYLGKHRRTETAAHLLDLIAMSKDETDLFISYIKIAMEKVFEPIGRQTRNIRKSYKFELNSRTIIIDEESESSESVDVIEYKEGDYVLLNGVLYIATGDGNSETLENLAPTADYRESVHYVLEWPETLNDNYIEPLDTSIQEALINYVIWRWLLSAYPDDADSYALLFGDSINDVKKNSGRLIKEFVERIPRIF